MVSRCLVQEVVLFAMCPVPTLFSSHLTHIPYLPTYPTLSYCQEALDVCSVAPSPDSQCQVTEASRPTERSGQSSL